MSKPKTTQLKVEPPIWRNIAFWNLIVSVLTGVIVVILTQLMRQNYDKYLLQESKSLEKYYATGALRYRRCGHDFG
jgi:hypothetical protein